MLKKITITFILMLFSLSLIQAQSLKLTTFGQSDRAVAISETDMFDVAYNGSQNVGVNSKVYLKVTLDSAFTSPAWTFPTKPSGSASALSSALVLDDMNQIISFTPDVKGKYVVEFSQGAGDIVTITINAGTYLGGASCSGCHSAQATKWNGTGHATTLSTELKGEGSTFFTAECVSCHSTGYDVNASNNGFDDRDFVFPNTLSPESYQAVLTNSPEAMKLADVQCEACHGPGSQHMGNTADFKIATSISSDNCAICHDSGEHNVLPAQWDVSRHGNPTTVERGSSASCAPCHSGSGFIAYVKNGQIMPAEIPAPKKISCAVVMILMMLQMHIN